MINPHCWSIQCIRRRLQTLPKRFYDSSSIHTNDSYEHSATGATETIDDTCQGLFSTIPIMGRGVLIDQYATMTRSYTSDDVESFGRLIRDFNPLHSSSSVFGKRREAETQTSDKNNHNDDETEEYLWDLQRSALEAAGLIRLQEDGETKALVHGMFVSSIFSSIFANVAPGCVYVNQGLEFCAPAFVSDTVVGCIHIERIRRRQKGGIVLECRTRVYKVPSSTHNSCQQQRPTEAQLVVRGSANVWLPIGFKYNEG